MKFEYFSRQILPKTVKLVTTQCTGYSTNITPIKMAADVFKSGSTRPCLPPLVAMHGYLGCKDNLKTVCKHLEKNTKRKVFSVDTRNHGKSPHDAAHSMEHIAADILLFVSNENISRLAVLGHSMGGRAMAYFSLKHPDMVEKVVIADMSPVSIPPDPYPFDNVLKEVRNIKISSNLSIQEGKAMAVKILKKVTGSQRRADFVVRNLKKSQSGEFYWTINADALYKNYEKTFDSTIYQNRQFNGPVLFIFGTRSPFYNEDDWPRIKSLFPSAHKEFLETGHLVHLEQQAKFIEVVSTFLKN